MRAARDVEYEDHPVVHRRLRSGVSTDKFRVAAFGRKCLASGISRIVMASIRTYVVDTRTGALRWQEGGEVYCTIGIRQVQPRDAER
jgi:hypothetical protein